MATRQKPFNIEKRLQKSFGNDTFRYSNRKKCINV